MSLSKFKNMLKTDGNYFFDIHEFEEIINYYIDYARLSLAKKALELGLEQHPNSIELFLLQVDLLLAKDNFPLAMELLDELMTRDPLNDSIYVQKSSVLSNVGKHDEAISVLKEALVFSDDLCEISYLLAMEYLYINDYNNALEKFKYCFEIDKLDYSSLHNIIYCYDMQSKSEEVIVFLKDVILNNPYCEIAWHQLGKQYLNIGNITEAIKSFDYSIAIDECFIGAYLEKAKALELEGAYKDAVENYLVVLGFDDPTVSTYYRIAICSENIDEKDVAIEYYEKAIYLDPTFEKAWVSLTNIYISLEKFDKALSVITNALQVEDTNLTYWRKITTIHLKLHLLDDARNSFYKSIRLGDTSIEVFLGLADLLLYLKNYEDSLSILISSIDFHSNSSDVEYRICGVYMITNKVDLALIHLKKALSIDSNGHTIMQNLFPSILNNKDINRTISNTFRNFRNNKN